MSRSDRKSKRKPHAFLDEKSGGPPASEIIIRDLPADLTQPETAEWPFREWPVSVAPRGTGFQVIIHRSVLNEINRHGQTARDVEVCGVLAGNVFRDDVGSYLLIEAAVRGDHADNSSANVTFTAETWSHIQGVMEKDHADLRIVGWYHTHPGFGIFLSDMDLFIHGNFFNLPWQVALVFDPVSGEDGVFIWRDSKTVRVPFVVVEDVEKEIVTVPVSAEITAAALADFSRRMQKSEKRQKTLVVILAFMALVAVAWPFVLFSILSDSRRPIRATPSERTIKILPGTMTDPGIVAIPTSAPTTTPTLATTVPAVPTTDPVTEAMLKPLPATIPPATTRPVDPSEKPEVTPTVIRPTTPINKGPRILEGPSEPPPQNLKSEI